MAMVYRWYHLYMELDDRYDDAVDALRGTLDDYDEDSRRVAALGADIYVKELDKPDSFLLGADRVAVAKSLFMAATAMVLIRDQMIEDGAHLAEVASGDTECTDEGCGYQHVDLDSDRMLAIIDGFDNGVAAVVGMALAVVDLAEEINLDDFFRDGVEE